MHDGFVAFLTLALALMLQSAAPQPATVQIFSDWAVACDNGRRCEAVSLGDFNEGSMALSISRDAAPRAVASLTIDAGLEPDTLPAGPFRLMTDRGALIRDGVTRAALLEGLTLPLNTATFALLRPAAGLDLRDRAGRVHRHASLAGLTAAMLYVDDGQRRLNTVTALVRPGRGMAALVPPAPPLPVIRHPAPTAGVARPMAAPSAAEQAAMQRRAGCDTPVEAGAARPPIRIDAQHHLFLLPCELFAYNATVVPFIGVTEVTTAVWTHARFDDAVPEGMETADGGRRMINGDWIADRRELAADARGRGLGDCGTGTAYAWDGRRFRLTHARSMPVCRGAMQWLTVWRAEVR